MSKGFLFFIHAPLLQLHYTLQTTSVLRYTKNKEEFGLTQVKKLRKLYQDTIRPMPKQSLLAMKVAFGVRAQYATVILLASFMMFQVFGVVIFSGSAQADGPAVVTTTAATKVAATTANFNGSASNEALTERGFEYGTSVSYGSTVQDTTLPTILSSVATYGTAGSGEGQFSQASLVALDSSNNIYVIDGGNNRIQKFNASGVYQTQWDPGFGSSINGIAVDQDDNVYVSTADKIQRTNSTGGSPFEWGEYGSEPGQFAGPMGIGVDSAGYIYVADSGNGRIQKFNSSGVPQGEIGSFGLGEGQFLNVSSVAINSAGDVYGVGDNRIQKFNSSGTYQNAWGGAGVGNGLLGGEAIAIGADNNIYLADRGNQRIQKFDQNGTFLGQWGAFGDGANQLAEPYGIAITNDGTLFVLEQENNRLHKLAEVDTATVAAVRTDLECDTTYHYRTYATNAEGTTYGSDQSFTTAACDPIEVVTGAASSITEITASLAGTTPSNGVSSRGFQYGTTTSYGSSVTDASALPGTMSYSSKWGALGSGDGQFNNPAQVALDSQGNVYVVDNGNSRVQKFNAAGVYQSQFGGWDGDETGNGLFRAPTGIAIDSADNIYVSDTSTDRIQKFDSNGDFVVQWGSGGTANGRFSNAFALAVDSSDNVYVVDSVNRKVEKYTSNGIFITRWGNDQSGSSSSADGKFSDPYSIAIDAADNVYVGDIGNGRVSKFTPGGAFVSKWGNPFSSGYPFGLAINPAGNIISADPTSHQLRLFTPTGTLISQHGVNGSGNGELNQPAGVVVNDAGLIYVTETGNDRVQTFTVPTSGMITASATGLTCGTSYHYRAFARNTGGTSYGDDATFSTTACPSDFVISPATLDHGRAGHSYSQTLSPSPTDGPLSELTYSVSSGSLPPGMELNDHVLSNDANLENVPTTAGTYSFTISATNDETTVTRDYTLVIDPGIAIATTSLAAGKVGSSYNQAISVTNVIDPVTFSISAGSLPAGLSINEDSGQISGTPTTVGTYNFTVRVTDTYTIETQALHIVITKQTTQEPPTIFDPPPQEPPVPNPDPDPDPPTITDVTPPPTVATRPPRTSPITSPQTVVAAENNIFALAKRIPEPFAIGFPWLLLVLALILVSIQYYQVHKESVATKQMQNSLAHQKQLVEEQNNFVALSTHYLHTPLTVMEGEITLMVKAGTITQSQATKLKATLSSLTNEAEATLAQEEQHELDR